MGNDQYIKKLVGGIPSVAGYESLFRIFRSCSNEEDVVQSFLASKLAELSPKSLLDVGAGDGTLAARLSGYADNILCLEPNKNFFDRIETTSSIAKQLTTLQDYKIQSQFDAILMIHVIEAIPRYQRMLSFQKLRKLVTDQGRVFVAHNSPYSGYNFIFHDAFRHDSLIQNRIRKLRSYLRHSGFIYFEHELEIEARFSSFDQFLAFAIFYTQLRENQIRGRLNFARGFYQNLPRVNGKKILKGAIRLFEGGVHS